MWNEGVGVYTRYIRRADGGAVAPDPVPDPSMGMPYYQTTEDMLPLLIDQGKEAERYGSIKPPESPTMAYAAEGFRGIERALEGNPAQFFLPGGGIANVVERKAYGEEPSAMDYGMAALDVADVTPVGKALGALKPLASILVGPAARSARKVMDKVDELRAKGLEGEDLWAAQADEARQGYYDPVDGKFRMEIDTRNARFNEGALVDKGSDKVGVPFNREGTKLEDILEFNEFFLDYPNFADIRVAPVPKVQGALGLRGQYDPVNKILYLADSKNKNEILSTALHELQHAVQAEERFLAGGSSSYFLPEDYSTMVKSARRSKQFLEGAVEERIKELLGLERVPLGLTDYFSKLNALSSPAEKRNLLEAAKKITSIDRDVRMEGYDMIRDTPFEGQTYWARTLLEKFDGDVDRVLQAEQGLGQELEFFRNAKSYYQELKDLDRQAYQNYRSIPGEVEARNVQERHARSLLDPDYRRRTYPPSDADTRIDEMVFPIDPNYRREYLRIGDMGPEYLGPVERKAAGGGVGSLSHIARAM